MCKYPNPTRPKTAFTTTLLLIAITILSLLTSTTLAQNYILKGVPITSTWLQSLGAFEPTTYLTVPQPQFQFSAFGRPYSVIASDSGALHFGDAKYLSQNECCNKSCSEYCDLSSDTVQTQLAAFPLQLQTAPVATFAHQYFSNATVHAYKTAMTTQGFTIRYAVVLIAPSTIIMGIEPNASVPTTFWNTVFSGLVGAPQSTFGTSPINDPTHPLVNPSNLFPNPNAYPPSHLVSYPRSQYPGRATVYCTLGGNSCGPSFLNSVTSPPHLIPITTNSDNACYRQHSSGFLMELLKSGLQPTDVQTYPKLNCLIILQQDDGTGPFPMTIAADYDRAQDVFTCTIPQTYETQTVNLASYTKMSLILASVETTMSTTAPYQPAPIWINVNWNQDWTQTTEIALDDDPLNNWNPAAAGSQFIPITTTPPTNFPFPTTDPISCQCRLIRYRGGSEASPVGFFPNEYGLSIQTQRLLRSTTPETPAGFNSTITEPFFTINDYCYSDCTGAIPTLPLDTPGFNNCGQCISINENIATNPAAVNNNQPLNCWNMCEALIPRNSGHFSYLNQYPITARTNGLIMPNSPFHDVDTGNISETPLVATDIACATATTQNAAGETVGFTTYRDHISNTLDPVEYFKYISGALSIIGLGFSIYLMIALARARERKRRRREEKNQQRLRPAPRVASSGNPSNSQPTATAAAATPAPEAAIQTPADDISDEDEQMQPRPQPQQPVQPPRQAGGGPRRNARSVRAPPRQ